MASFREYRDFDSLGTPFASIKNPRQEKGTIKVDMHLVQEELCTTVFAHRAILSKPNMSDEARQAYLTSSEKQDEEVVRKTGRGLGMMKDMGELKAATYLTDQKHQQVVEDLKIKAKDLLATIEILEETVAESEENGGDNDLEDASGMGIGTPGLNRATRHGRGTKRKLAEDELLKKATDFQKMTKTMKDEQRLS